MSGSIRVPRVVVGVPPNMVFRRDAGNGTRGRVRSPENRSPCGKYRKGETGRAQGLGMVIHSESDERKTATVDEVLAISKETGLPAGQVAIAWVLAKGMLPIIGPRTLEQLADNLASAEAKLSAEQIQRLDNVSAITLGFPHDVVSGTTSWGES